MKIPQGMTARDVCKRNVVSARSSLTSVVVFSAVNTVLQLIGSSLYFLFSASLPIFLVQMGRMFTGKIEGYAPETLMDDNFLIGMSAIAIFVVLLYAGAWFFSKNNPKLWFTIAAVLMVIDTFFLVATFVLFGIDLSSVLDIVFHAWILVSLFKGIKALDMLSKMPPEPMVHDVPYNDVNGNPPTDNGGWNNTDNQNNGWGSDNGQNSDNQNNDGGWGNNNSGTFNG